MDGSTVHTYPEGDETRQTVYGRKRKFTYISQLMALSDYDLVW